MKGLGHCSDDCHYMTATCSKMVCLWHLYNSQSSLTLVRREYRDCEDSSPPPSPTCCVKLFEANIQVLTVVRYLAFILKWWWCHCQVIHIVSGQRAAQQAKFSVSWLHWMFLQANTYHLYEPIACSHYCIQIYYPIQTPTSINQILRIKIFGSETFWLQLAIY
jgi:hypothetical protein